MVALVATSGCSTVIEGRSQNITVNSYPPGAQCIFKQADDVVARITTPGTANVGKSKNDLVILCNKAGYESVSLNNHSDMALASLGNMVLGQYSFIGNAVDSASGANNKYDSVVNVTLVAASAPGAFPAPPGPPAVIEMSTDVAARMSMQAPMPAMALAPAALPVPAPAAPERATVFTSISEPAIKASVNLAKAANASAAGEQVTQLTYAETSAQAPLRPPFAIGQ